MGSSLTGTIIAEKYKLGDLLRSNEYGDLYDARHALMDKPVAVRVLRPSLAADSENVEKFFTAAKAASKISDPHVQNLHDFGTDHEGFVYAVYEPLEGKTLKSVIAEDGVFPAHSAVETATQIAAALVASHAAGQIHGNLSTENVMLTGVEGIAVKVVEFGSPNPLIDERTDPSDFAYLAPELCSGSDNPDERSDVYSLGAILFEMLAGVPPFTGDKPTDVMVKHMEEIPPPLTDYRNDVPDGLETVIARTLSKSPDARQQTAQEFADELTNVSGALSGQAAAAPQNNLWKTAFIVLVGMTLLGTFLIYGTYMRRTDPATAMQPDANGQPVQPINPATGTEEQALAAMPALTADAIANSNMAQIPGTLPGGDGYNPWATGAPPPGAPMAPGGQVVTIDPATGSPFMPSDGGVVLVPVPVNTNTNTAKPTPTPKPSTANANAAPQASPTPQTNSTPAKPTPTPAARPAKTPARPANRPPANTVEEDVDES